MDDLVVKEAGAEYDLEDRLISFSALVIDVVEAVPQNRAGNHVAGQLVRSGTSAAPNYGEAQGAESRRDFIHKLRICLKELKETRTWLKLCRKKGYGTGELVSGSLDECEQLVRIVARSIETAKKNMTGDH